MLWTIVFAVVAGSVVGPLARLALPGRQSISILLTIVFGAAGSLVGTLIYYSISGDHGTTSVDWVSGVIGVVVAAALILGYSRVRGEPPHPVKIPDADLSARHTHHTRHKGGKVQLSSAPPARTKRSP
jgi:uncharacterized membrane protein YeaQ/YmgE (transglycosylase-associated protein family)